MLQLRPAQTSWASPPPVAGVRNTRRIGPCGGGELEGTMRLGVKDVADRLGVSERTVFQWVERDKLPATQVDGQFRFNPAAVYEWATSRGVPIPGNLFEEDAGRSPVTPLTRALRAGGVIVGLKGEDKAEVLRAAVGMLNLPPHADRDVILHMLLAREKLGSTGIGEGFAIPHVRNPIVLRVPEPLVTLFILDHPIDFGAIDRRPVHSVFLAITPTTQSHLLILSRLAAVLQNSRVRAVIAKRAEGKDILAEIERAEAPLNGDRKDA
jgi:nitrogen PTS system EIIA component